MKKIPFFLQCTVTVAAGILIIFAATCSLNGTETIPASSLWDILLASVLCALATTLLFPDGTGDESRIPLQLGLHFLSLCAIMVFCGVRFGWIEWSLGGVAYMVVAVVLVHGFTTGISYALAYRQVQDMNRALREKRFGENRETD